MRERLLAKNAKVQVNVPVGSIRHYYPTKGDSETKEASIVRLRAIDHSRYGFPIYDEREDSVMISSALARIRNAEKNVRHLLDKEEVAKAKDEAKIHWPEYFGLNASVWFSYDERNNECLILRDPEENEPESLLTCTPLIKDAFSSFSLLPRGINWHWQVLDHNEEKRISRFLLITVTNEKSPIVVFHREIKDDKCIFTDYIIAMERRVIQRTGTIESEKWLEGGPNPDPVAEEKVEAVTEDKTETEVETTEEESVPTEDESAVTELEINHDLATIGEILKNEPPVLQTKAFRGLQLRNGEPGQLVKAGYNSPDELFEAIDEEGYEAMVQKTGVSKSKLRKAYEIIAKRRAKK